MKKNTRSQITDDTLKRLSFDQGKQAQLRNVTVLHAFIAQNEKANEFLDSMIKLFKAFFNSLEQDERGVLKPSQDTVPPCDFKDLCRIALVNFYDARFEHRLKDEVERIQQDKAASMMAKVLAAERKKPEFDNLAKVEKFEHESLAEQDELEDFLNTDKNCAASEHDREVLSMLVQDRIDVFKSLIPQMEKTIRKIQDEIKSSENDIDFLFAPAKDHTRAFTKLCEDVQATLKFPLGKLKDIARGTFKFADPSNLLSFLNQFKNKIENSKGLSILQVKNSFDKGGDEYKDIKLIIGYESDGRVWPIEMQFLLASIGDAKTALHQFQDITRADFTVMQASFFGRLATYVKENGSEQTFEDRHQQSLFKQGKEFYEWAIKREWTEKYVKPDSEGEGWSNKIYENEKNIYSNMKQLKNLN